MQETSNNKLKDTQSKVEKHYILSSLRGAQLSKQVKSEPISIKCHSFANLHLTNTTQIFFTCIYEAYYILRPCLQASRNHLQSFMRVMYVYDV